MKEIVVPLLLLLTSFYYTIERASMNYKKQSKKLLTFARKNYFIPIFVAIVFFVGAFACYKLFFDTSTFIYVKVKVGQGLWWANTLKPSSSIANAIKKGDQSYDILGKTQAEVISVRRYPTWGNTQYDVDLILKLKVNKNSKTETYTFNRSTISIGSPVEIEFPKADITGTVIDLKEKPFVDKYVDKIILLVNQGGYNKDFPYRYENIQIGDTYFDGEENVFEILDKKLEKNIWTIVNNLNGQIYEQSVSTTQNILVRAKIRVREVDKQFYFGSDYKVNTNASIPFSTPNFYFEAFLIRKVE